MFSKKSPFCSGQIHSKFRLQKMFILQFLPFLQAQLKLCNFFCSIPYIWEERTKRVKTLPHGGKYRLYIAQLLFHSFYLVGMTANLVFVRYFSDGPKDLTKQFVGVVFLSVYLTCGVCRLNFFLYEMEGCQLINSFLSFESKFMEGDIKRRNLKNN